MGSVLGVSWLQFGAGGVLVLVVLFVILGWLATPNQLKRERQNADERIAEARAEAATWRDAYLTLLKSQDVTNHYLGQLTTVGDTMNSLLKALPQPKPSSEGGHDATTGT